ncbi:zinc finger protein 433 [Spodoptera litura]|uniref:Zinc finger protein 433 n=1 Tax=Spodoptera litura TaxID=69820 RepID=A0A9J7INZ4_SPOLT|nr:zinc finger protein 433 [Spodoptera litura]
MLSPREDDDDDSHLCIKCNTTIVGLDNYVKHRKQRCGKLKPEDPKPELPAIDTLEPSYSLGADVFFQSLELQSSVKKTSLSRLTPPIPISKASIDRKASLAVPSTSRDLPRMSPLENNLRGEDWIGGHSLRIGSNEDNQTKLINAVASISGASQVKKDIIIPTSSYSINYDYKGDEESDESEESEDDEEEDHPTGEWKPPPNYTGGKWRPASPDHEDWDMREEQEHTGGKWKPIMPDNNERDEDYDAPPPGHTKGKWVPGANEKTQIMQTTIQTKGSVQYWCGPCNRRLNSRAIYDKHLRSSLHLKKVLPEHELEFSGHLEPMKPVMDKRLTRPSRFVNDDIYSQVEKKRHSKTVTKINIKIEKKKRKRKPTFVHCSGCKSRVRQHLMGKHLISHYHFRKATDTNTATYQQLILDNMDAIVHQSPFQCSPCKFYTNWLSTFMQHWFSEEHEQKLASIEGRLWCSFCKFECESSQEMLQHMSSSDHSEVVAVINRSMPIIIRKKTLFKCDACSKDFRYNIEMKRHYQTTGHPLAVTATDNYQELHNCQHCKAKFKSSLTLAAHLKSKHKQRAYLCLVCAMSFKSSDEAKRHRQTSEHRIKRKENLREQGLPTKDMSKKCPYCTDNVILRNILVLKEHIRRMHPNIRKKCPNCGMSFILSQEVTRHVRDNACQLSQTAQITSSIFWNCSQCLFTTDSQAECFFHEVLHTTPKEEVLKVGDTEKVLLKYPCPLCPKTFRKASLRQHLRQHTFERPFICSTCGANFTRQTSLANHSKNEHSTEVAKIPKLPAIVERIEDWECGKCKNRFSSKSALSRHTSSCASGPTARHCPHDQCTYVATNSSQLARHRRSHGERIKHHECHLCTFKSDQASHMKRHMLCHQGVKPYACPHCSFTCGSLENLRKHVLRSGRHPGLFLYHCRLCPYNTNTATELRAHLTTAHSHKYNAKTAIEAVKLHLIVENNKK